MRKIFLLTILLQLLVTVTLQAQNNVDEWAKKALVKSYSLKQERAYLTFDNNAYYLGETIWFKAYVTSGRGDFPTTVSKVLYVELLSPEGYIIETKKYRLDDDGCCHGEFELNPRLLSGFYEIRAYTRYMTNWGKEAVFSRVFPIFDKVHNGDWGFRNMHDRKRKVVNTDGTNDDEPMLTFFPEGGNLVAGVESKVAFELRDASGNFADDTVTIFENNKIITKVAPVHNGKGVFNITPKSGAKYKAKAVTNDNDGKKKSVKTLLPKVNEQGAVVRVSQDSVNADFLVRNNFTDTFDIGFAIMYRGSMGFYRKFSSSQKEIQFTIPKNDLPEGVCRAVLIVCDTIPLAERQFFVQHSNLQKGDRQTVKLNAKANKYHIYNYNAAPNEKIEIEIEREDGKPIDERAIFAFAVRDAAGNGTTSWDYNMYSYLLLGSELKGYIPDAAQYFDKDNSERERNLDLIMLTHGWTSYNWAKLLTVDIPSMQTVEKELLITGVLYRRNEVRKLNIVESYKLTRQPNTQVRLDAPQDDGKVAMSIFRTDSVGKFFVAMDNFYGKRVVLMTAEGNLSGVRGVNYSFSLDRYFSPSLRPYSYWECNLGHPATKSAEAKEEPSAEMTRVNPFEYKLSEISVVDKKKMVDFARPPMSELRLDYLDEWEYAQDVTYLEKPRYAQEYDNELFEALALELELKTESKYVIEITNKLQENSSGGRDRMPEYRDALTAADVMSSAVNRHKLKWSFWTQFAVHKGDYNPDSLPKIDKSYLHGKDPHKMTNFKEIIIRSDKPALELAGSRGEGFYNSQSAALENKNPYKMFYMGFLSLYSAPVTPETIENNGAFGDFEKLLNAHKIGRAKKEMKLPNYLAIFVPRDENDANSPIMPELERLLPNKRYTMLQGYTQSKEFYSPDYSKIPPLPDDYRRTLYWSPKVRAKDGKLIVELYNTSFCSNIDVSVSGRLGNLYFSNDNNTTTRYCDKWVVAKDRANEEDPEKRIVKFEADSVTLATLEHHYNTGLIYYNQHKYRKAINIFAELLQYNYPPAFYSVGRCYLYGQGVVQNDTLAADFMKNAAQRGDIAAQYEYAMMFRNNNNKKSRELFLYWLRNAADEGESRAQIELGNCYCKGYGVEKDSVEALRYYKLSADQKNPLGLFRYAYTMEQMGVKDNSFQMSDYTNIIADAANKGVEEAMLYMMRHEHNKENYKAAYSWARQLSLVDNHIGTTYMADCYLEGKGVKRNKQLAKDLYRQAAYAGNKEAVEKLKTVK